MANNNHLEILRRGRDEWNMWRNEVCCEQPDFRNAVLSGMDFSGFNFAGANFYNAQLQDTNLSGANLGCANFGKVDLSGAILKGANCGWTSFTESQMVSMDLRGMNFAGSKFNNTQLEGSNFFRAFLQECEFIEACLRGVIFTEADLTQANLHSADLRKADLTRANLEGAQITDTILHGAALHDWIINGIRCNRIFWGQDGTNLVKYQAGEFERLFSAPPKIVFKYPGKIGVVEIVSLHSLIQLLQKDMETYSFKLNADVDTKNNSTVTITLDSSDGKNLDRTNDIEKLQQMMEETLGWQMEALKEKDRRYQIEHTLKSLQESILPFALRKVNLINSGRDSTVEYSTIIFLDIVNSSSGGDEETNELVKTFWGLCVPSIKDKGGQYINTWGDALVASFEDINVGITCACKLVKLLEVENIISRVGINYGRILVRLNPITERTDMVGEVVNIAARIQAEAEAGEILVTQRVKACRDLNESLFEFHQKSIKLSKPVKSIKKGQSLEVYSVNIAKIASDT